MRRADARRVAVYGNCRRFSAGGQDAPISPQPGSPHMRLAKPRKGAYTKTGTPAPTARRKPGLARRVSAPLRHTATTLNDVFDPVSGAQIRGQLLVGVRRQKQDQYQRDKRDQKQTLHG